MGGQTRLMTLFPWWLVVALLLALAFAIFGIWLYKRSLHKEAGELFKEKFHQFLTRHQLFFSRFGLFGTNPLGQSFLHALKMMQVFVGGPQFRYSLPWIVMMGSTGSGKSALLRSLGLDRPIGHSGEPGEVQTQQLCDWWFYDHGIVLDVDGRLVLNAAYPTSDTSNWSFFLNLLRHYRPKRPLDAVVLTIPASEFVGASAFSHDDIMLRAESIYAKLWQMQRVTGLKVPIYIVVSKCDLVPGFEDFCQAIPLSNGSDMFGWSCDKGIESAYTSEWIEEAFGSLDRELDIVQEEIYAEGGRVDGVDGVFVFPLSFAQMKKGLRIYTDHIFKSSGYHDSFFLRGLYFVGDSHCAAETGDEASLAVREEDSERRNIYFARDLFEKKIFREKGLAQPVTRLLLSGQTTNRSAKFAIGTTAILGTLALLKANQSLQDETRNLMTVLPQMESTLQKLHSHDSKTAVGRAYFAEQTHTLLETMAQTRVNVLFSPLLVPSWWSTLDSRIRDVMIIVYDKIILRSMAEQLNYKAEQLISLNEQGDLKAGPGEGGNPLQTREFQQLNDYVEKMYVLQLAADKFNALGVKSTLGDIAEIISYLFNYQMPNGFFVDNYYYVCALKQTTVRLFNFATYQENATIKLSKLFNAFQTATFNPNTMIPGLAQLMVSFRGFAEARGQAAQTIGVVRDVFTSLDQTIRSLNNPGLQWLNQNHFAPGVGYDSMLRLIGASEFFIEKNIQAMIGGMDQNFLTFRRRLAGYSSPLLGGQMLFAQENGLALAAPSAGAVALKNSLHAFFNEPFMAPTTDKKLIETVPNGSILLWDTLTLQQAVELIGSYNDFVNSRLFKMAKPLQPLFQKLAREGLNENIMDRLVTAQLFGSETGDSAGYSPEDVLMPQVQNYRVATPFLEQILSTLWVNGASSHFSALKNLLFSEVYSSLEALDSILEEEAPYGIKMDSFAWWRGQPGASLEAFGVSNMAELKHYLALQRDRIHYLAQEFAAPLVSLLEIVEQKGMPDNAPLIAKWGEIIDDLSGYDRKTAGNGLHGLEEFILNPLNTVTLATCSTVANDPIAMELDYDFFTETLMGIQEKLQEQCAALSGKVSVGQYTEVACFFNANLAGRFPFVAKPDPASPDADPEDIRTFFEMLDTQAAGIKATLMQAPNLGPAGKNALRFIEQMECVRKFFGDFLSPKGGTPEPAFTFDVTFRVNKDREARANEVLSWAVVSNETKISMRSSSHKGYWKVGDPFRVVFKWAANSPLQPMAGGGQTDLSVNKEKATYAYGGTWALLRALRQHQAGPSDFKNLEDCHPTTLRFDVPLTNTLSGSCKAKGDSQKKAVLFVSVAVAPAKPKKPKKEEEGDAKGAEKVEMGTPVVLPYFPPCAPELAPACGCR